MLSVEVGEPTIRRKIVDLEVNEEQLRMNLETLQERRDVAVIHVEAHKRLVARRYNTKVRSRQFREGDLVWRKTDQARKNQAHRKLAANWEGPFRVRENLNNGAYRLEYLNGKVIPNT